MGTSYATDNSANATYSTVMNTERSSVRKPLFWSDLVKARQDAQHAQPIFIPVAAQAVFSTWELCENILQHLSCADLSRARRICSTSNAVIKRSSSLQQALFLKSSGSNLVSDLSRLSEDTLPMTTKLVKYLRISASSVQEVLTELHPVLKGERLSFTPPHNRWELHDPSRLMFRFDLEFRDIHRIAATSLHSDLNNMLVCQPPTPLVRVKIFGRRKKPRFLRYSGLVEEIYVYDVNGVTFGKLFKEIGWSIRQHPNATVNHMRFG